MKKEKGKKEERQLLNNIEHTIRFLKRIIEETNKSPIEEFLIKEIQRLERMEKHIKENGKSS